MRRLDHEEPSGVAQKSETHRATISKFSFPNSFWNSTFWTFLLFDRPNSANGGDQTFCPLFKLPVREGNRFILSSWEKLFNIFAALEASFGLFWDFLKAVRFLFSSEFDCCKCAGDGSPALWVLSAVPLYSTSDLTNPDRSSQVPHPGET